MVLPFTYLDGVSFTHKYTHKYDAMDQARAPKKKLWRKKSERLAAGLTTKSNNVGVVLVLLIVSEFPMSISRNEKHLVQFSF